MDFEDQHQHTGGNGAAPCYDDGGFPLTEPPLQMRKPRYRECQKNHAVGIGGHAVDGCGEFMPAGDYGTLDGLRCAACNCHRNFHRKEAEPSPAALVPFGYHHHRAPSGFLLHAPPPLRPLALTSISGGAYREEMEEMGSSKKRFRTKFTAEQKEKMQEVAERMGWRINRENEEAVEQLCNEYGIRRHVFKVWMHNNKHNHLPHKSQT